MIGEGEKTLCSYQWFRRFMSDYSLHRGRKYFCRYCLHPFVTEEILKRHIKDYFKINGKQTSKMPKKSEHVKLKKYKQ